MSNGWLVVCTELWFSSTENCWLFACRSQWQILVSGKWRQYQCEPVRSTTIHLRVPCTFQDGYQSTEWLLHPWRAERHYERYQQGVWQKQDRNVGVLAFTVRHIADIANYTVMVLDSAVTATHNTQHTCTNACCLSTQNCSTFVQTWWSIICVT